MELLGDTDQLLVDVQLANRWSTVMGIASSPLRLLLRLARLKHRLFVID